MKTKHTGNLFAVFLLLFMGAFVWFLAQAQRWYWLSKSTVQAASEIAPLSKEDMAARLTPIPMATEKEVKYRTFFLTSPGAEKVELRGDFNRWGKDVLELAPYKKGYFETSIALAAGEYQYEFVVDGIPQPDPVNKDRRTLPDGREVCIKTVR